MHRALRYVTKASHGGSFCCGRSVEANIVEGYLERLRERAMAAWHGLIRKKVSPTS